MSRTTLDPWQWSMMIYTSRSADDAGFLVRYMLTRILTQHCREITAGPPSLASEPAAEGFERLLRDLAACSCRYGLRKVDGAPGPYVLHFRPGIHRPEWMTRCFVIDPRCTHHGEGNRIIRTVRKPGGPVYLDMPYPWQDKLSDEDERR